MVHTGITRLTRVHLWQCSRAKSARGWFAFRGNADPISAATHAANLRSSLGVDDLILSTRGTVGLCAIVEKDVLPANIDQDVARICLKSDADLSPKYLLAYLNCRFGQDWMTRNAAGMVQQGLSLAKVRDMPIPRLSAWYVDSSPPSFSQSTDALVQLRRT
jgi:hypothetical protein